MNTNTMKKVILILFMLAVRLAAWSSEPVSIIISDGVDNDAVKAKMERAMSALFTEAGAAYESNRTPNYQVMGITEDAMSDIAGLWENSPFICDEPEVVQHCLITGSGYQVRNIPLELIEADEDDKYHEAVINFDRQGNMMSFHLSISNNLYMDILKNNKEISDLRRRQLILDWVEQFRTAYNQKDINFLEVIFSDDALIITGRVVEPDLKNKDGVPLPPKVEMYKKTKREYLDKLKITFKNTKYIRVTFDEIEVKMHPVSKDVYGVTLHQAYTSDKYHDDGYLFLLWDFKDEQRPKIHVRAWQPDTFQGNKITDDQKISLKDFDI